MKNMNDPVHIYFTYYFTENFLNWMKVVRPGGYSALTRNNITFAAAETVLLTNGRTGRYKLSFHNLSKVNISKDEQLDFDRQKEVDSFCMVLDYHPDMHSANRFQLEPINSDITVGDKLRISSRYLTQVIGEDVFVDAVVTKREAFCITVNASIPDLKMDVDEVRIFNHAVKPESEKPANSSGMSLKDFLPKER